MILKINPADVVSIPTDYDGAKGRCMKYEVVAQVNGNPRDAFSSVVNTEYTPPVTSEKATWPFPNAGVTSSSTQLYDLIRTRTKLVEYVGLTLAEAQARVAKNVSQKKVTLSIVITGTNITV